MKNILVPIEEHLLLDAVANAAVSIGRTHGSFIEGVAVSVDQISAYAADLHFGVVPGLDPVSRQEMADAARRRFDSLMTARGVNRAMDPEGLCQGWRQDLLMGDEQVGAYGRVFDLTILGRPSNRTGHPRMATLEAALFESGRPILMVPPAPPPEIGRRVMIAWNRSTETARAVIDARPFFAKAQDIIVLEIENWGVDGPSALDLVSSLARHHLPVRLHTVPGSGKGPGETILAAAQSFDCDLLVKGAYTQSRLRQMIFGGATSHILTNATMPVLFAH